jgi:hypothetical protein
MSLLGQLHATNSELLAWKMCSFSNNSSSLIDHPLWQFFALDFDQGLNKTVRLLHEYICWKNVTFSILKLKELLPQ